MDAHWRLPFAAHPPIQPQARPIPPWRRHNVEPDLAFQFQQAQYELSLPGGGVDPFAHVDDPNADSGPFYCVFWRGGSRVQLLQGVAAKLMSMLWTLLMAVLYWMLVVPLRVGLDLVKGVVEAVDWWVVGAVVVTVLVGPLLGRNSSLPADAATVREWEADLDTGLGLGMELVRQRLEMEGELRYGLVAEVRRWGELCHFLFPV